MVGLAGDLWPGLRLAQSALTTTCVAELRGLVLGSAAEIERPKHRDVDAQTSKHELDGAEHKGRKRGSSKIADEIDHGDLPKPNAANYTASARIY